ncbi:glycine betaine ABC transporter substrate-binding protein [Paraburkholderia bonniea]|uniref:glycine betaine ABC transporter substrate-binding protein n=1 Tax=Paraburkholderia bonniea TaxID=2152891 RepID=UPI001290FBFB|nr:glycine betaine ABC transporter substrate-binding protein [Paraburkholderia bonniea]WJF91808.1 glycine betaine ABC transporter substrate-binding protein [Paraburkholderia bonniea]WJF95127.1 glycine betaine ABC transporter substrate-binding protein [Paraburkholderia bonniea]
MNFLFLRSFSGGLANGLARYFPGRWLLLAALLATSVHASAAALIVGSKNFTEQYVLAELTAQYLRAQGYPVETRTGLGSTLLRSAQEHNQIDIVWEYTGTAAIVYNKITEKLDPKTMYERVKALDARRGLVWLDASPLNNTYALGLPHEVATATGIHTISQLAERMNAEPDGKYVFAMDAEFANRPDGLKPLEMAYGMRFTRKQTKQMDPGLVYTALHNNQVFVGLIYTTDGRVKGFDIRPLEDDKGFFPPYNATPVVREAILKQNPRLAAQLNALSAALDNDVILEMNKQVDIDGKSIQTVAREFLRDHPALSGGKP